LRTSLLILTALALFAGCSDDQTPVTNPPAEKASVERGAYIVQRLGPCGQCHTPKDPMGMPINDQFLAGDDCFLDVDPLDPNAGCIATPNLTSHATGLANRSDAEIKAMITQGMRPDGSAMFPIMPYFVIARFTEVDIDSIILYLRTVKPVDRKVAPSQPPFDVPIPKPAPALGEDEMPMPTTQNEATMRGRYLVTTACITCHTPLTEITDFRSLDKNKLFAGGNNFASAVLGLPNPPLPAVIYSTNLTPDPATGLNYSKAEIIALLKSAKAKDGSDVCPPMPIKNAYQNLTDGDLSDIADYVLALPPIVNNIPNTCP